MKLNELIKVLIPPSSPVESGVGLSWPKIDNNLDFPSDYIEFINTYGTGDIAGFIVIFNPFSQNDNLNFFEQKAVVLESFNYLLNQDRDYYKYRLYPDDNGLLPIGFTGNGDYLFWVTSSSQDSSLWTTAIIASRSPDVEYFDQGLIALLESILSKKIKSTSFPDSFPPDDISFNANNGLETEIDE